MPLISVFAALSEPSRVDESFELVIHLQLQALVAVVAGAEVSKACELLLELP